jgi:hypothetical protein
MVSCGRRERFWARLGAESQPTKKMSSHSRLSSLHPASDVHVRRQGLGLGRESAF